MEEDKFKVYTESTVQQILAQSRTLTAEQLNEMMEAHPPVTSWTSWTSVTEAMIEDKGVDSGSDIKGSKTLLEEVIDKNKNLLLLELPIMIKQTRSKTGYVLTDKTGKKVYLEKDEDGLLFNLQEDFGV